MSAIDCHLKPPDRSVRLIVDANQNVLAAGVQLGEGRAVVWADDYSYWDFCAQRNRQGTVASVPSSPGTQALFKWFLAGHTSSQKGQLVWVEAERMERQGPLILRYSRPIESAARKWIGQLPAITELVEECNRQAIPVEPTYTIHFLASGGGGWAGLYAAGVCVYGGTYPVRVCAHELTHSIANPLPAIFGEAWAVTVGLKAGHALGGAGEARAEEDSIRHRLDEVDPQRNRLDLMKSEQGPYNHDYQHKAVWLLSECEKKYGDDFMSRVLRRRDVQYGIRKPITLTQLFRLFSDVSQDPGFDGWLKSLGISVSTNP